MTVGFIKHKLATLPMFEYVFSIKHCFISRPFSVFDCAISQLFFFWEPKKYTIRTNTNCKTKTDGDDEDYIEPSSKGVSTEMELNTEERKNNNSGIKGRSKSFHRNPRVIARNQAAAKRRRQEKEKEKERLKQEINKKLISGIFSFFFVFLLAKTSVHTKKNFWDIKSRFEKKTLQKNRNTNKTKQNKIK